MKQHEILNQELNRHNEISDRNLEHHQAMNLDEKKRGIAAANQNSSIARIVNIISYLFGALDLLLGIRVILQAIGANPDNGFVKFIYDLSTPFVGLFTGIIQNPILGETGVLEVTTIIAMIVWAIFGWLVGRLIWLVLSRPR